MNQISSREVLWNNIGIPQRGLALHAAISKGFSYTVFLQIADITRISKKELAANLSIDPDTLLLRAKSGSFNSYESDRLYHFTDMLSKAAELFQGNLDEAVVWLSSNIKGLGGNRPVDMLSTSSGSDAVTDLIGRLEHGVLN
jgi:putative toxin-antitoxin system antitoxin component (TIGR02293 family)